MLKAILDSMDGVDESIHGFYQEKDGKFHLEVDGLEDTGALKRAKDHEKNARKSAEEKATSLEAQIAELTGQIEQINDDKSRGNGDVEALENSWKTKLSNRENELTGQIDTLKGSLNELLIDSVAGRMAAEIATEGSAGVLVPHIQNRLGVEERDGKMITVVKDSSGKPSATTVDELRQEFKDNPVFAPVIVGSKASGGGASGGDGGGASKLDYSKATPKQIADHIKAKRGN